MKGLEYLKSLIEFKTINNLFCNLLKKETQGEQLNYYFSHIEYIETEIMEILEPISCMSLVFNYEIKDGEGNIIKDEIYRHKLDFDSVTYTQLLWIGFFNNFIVTKFNDQVKEMVCKEKEVIQDISKSFIKTIQSYKYTKEKIKPLNVNFTRNPKISNDVYLKITDMVLKDTEEDLEKV